MTKEKIEAYIEKHSKWAKQIKKFRKLALSEGMEETIKWRMPTYLIDGKMVVGIGAFKNHVALWFFQGVFLEDKKGLLVNAQKGKTKAMRHMKFEEGDKIDDKIVKSYFKESIKNHRAGKVIAKAKPQKEYVLAPHLDTEFKKNASLKKAFYKLTASKQREYSNYISEAKREATKLSRINSILPLIKDGKGLNHKFSGK